MIGSLIMLGTLNGLFLFGMYLTYVLVYRRRMNIRLLVEHLSSITERALSLQTGLRMLAHDLGGILGTRLQRVARRLDEGRSLGGAFEDVPKAAPPLVRSMVALGERSGNLAAFLRRTKESIARSAELDSGTASAYMYPVVLTSCITFAFILVYGFLFPRFEAIFDQMGLPNFVEEWRNVLFSFNQAVLLICVCFVVLGMTGGSRWPKGGAGFRAVKRGVDAVILGLPSVGRVLADRSVAVFSLSTGLFLKAGATLPEAVSAAAEEERNEVFRRRFARVAAAVGEGTPLSRALRDAGGMPPDLVWFVEAGEPPGPLPEHLLQAATHYETRVRFGAQMASRLLVPLFIILNGAVVLGTVLLVLVPVFQLQRSMVPS